MKISCALALTSQQAVETAISKNLEHWMHDVLFRVARAGRLPTGRVPYGAVNRVFRAAMAGFRPDNAQGVATGQWLLPCQVPAAQVWLFFQSEMRRLSFQQLCQGLIGRSTPSLIVSVPRRWGATVSHKPKPKPTPKPFRVEDAKVDTRLFGLNNVRLRTRFEKAFAGGDFKLRCLMQDLNQTLERLPQLEGLDPVEVADATRAVRETRAWVWVVLRCLNRMTPERVVQEEALKRRLALKAAKRAARRKARLARKAARVVAAKVKPRKVRPTADVAVEQPAQQPLVQDNVVRLADIRDKPWFRILVTYRGRRLAEASARQAGTRYYGQKARNTNATLKDARRRLSAVARRMSGEDLYQLQALLAA